MKQVWKGIIGLLVMAAIVVQAVPLAGAAEVLGEEISAENQGALEEYRTERQYF